MELARIERVDRYRPPADHGAGIESPFHPHDGDAGLPVSCQDRALDGGGPAPARQERGVDIETPEARRRKDRLRQDQAIGGHHRHIGRERAEPVALLLLPEIPRMMHPEAEALGFEVHRRREFTVAAPTRAGRLSIDGGNIISGAGDGPERRHREVR